MKWIWIAKKTVLILKWNCAIHCKAIDSIASVDEIESEYLPYQINNRQLTEPYVPREDSIQWTKRTAETFI